MRATGSMSSKIQVWVATLVCLSLVWPAVYAETPPAPVAQDVVARTASAAGDQETRSESEVATAPEISDVSGQKPVRVSDVSNWAVVLVSLLGIIFMIFALGWIVRRMGGLRAMGVRDMKVVAALPVGNRERVAVVQVQGKQFLLGITTQQITHLHTFDAPAVEDTPESRDFLATFKGVMGNKHNASQTPQSEHEA